MADLNITIPSPQLTTGQYFKVRYRQLPSGTWSGYSNQSNAPFTITGLSVGDYQLEFKLVNADASECAAVYRVYTITPDYECISFSSNTVGVNNITYFELTYTLPPGHTAPPCGWELEYSDGTTTKTSTYASLPPSGTLRMPVPNVAGVVRVFALLCNGKKKECHAGDVTPVVYPPPCIPMSNVSINILEQLNNGVCEYFLEIKFTQSSPTTTSAWLKYDQAKYLLAFDKFAGFIPIPANANKILWKLNPTLASNFEMISYNISFIDRCQSQTFIKELTIDRLCW